MVVKIYKDKVLIPNLVSEISSDIEIMLHTIEKKIKGIIINFNADINKSDAAVKILDIIKLRGTEIKEFNNVEKFDKSKPITKWERQNTLDC